jgi:hypothetical protein
MAFLQRFACIATASLSGERNGQEIGKMLNTVLIDAVLERNSPNFL